MPQWLDQLLKGFGYLRADSALPMVVREIAANAEQREELWRPDQSRGYMDAYEKVSWIYGAVSRIAEAAAFVPFHVTEVEQEEEEQITDHPFEKLLRRPNPQMAQFQLMEQTVGFLKTTGNAFWYLNIVGNEPKEIWNLRPDRMRPIPDRKEYIKGWIYDIEGHEETLEAREVVWFSHWHPQKEFMGLSPVAAAAMAVETDSAAADYNRKFFGQDAAKPAGMVVIEEMVPDGEFKRVKKEWLESFGGTERRTAFTRGQAVKWQQVGLSQEDMQWLEGRKFSQEEIMTGIYNIPPGMYRESATQANAKIAREVFLGDVIWPMLVRLAQTITARVLIPFYGEELEGQFEDIRPVDRALLVQEMTAAMNPMLPLLTVDEARRRYFQLGPMEVEEEEPKPEEPEVEPEAPESEEEVLELDEHEEIRGELEKWQRKARRWLKDRGTADAPFNTAQVPAGVAGAIRYRLAEAKTAEEVKAAFAVPF